MEYVVAELALLNKVEQARPLQKSLQYFIWLNSYKNPDLTARSVSYEAISREF